MYIFVNMCVSFLVTMLLVQGVASNDEGEKQTEDFDVIPGGQTLSFKKDWEGAKFSCNFTYQAQGGTKEQWEISLFASTDRTKYSCTVYRPGSSSYLFFQKFRMEVYGVRLDEVEAVGPDGSARLTEGEYSVDENQGSVSSVDGKFKSMLGRVTIYASKPKEEL